MVVKNVGSALRYCLPQQVGKKVGEFWELIKPLIDFKYEVKKNSKPTKKNASTFKIRS